MSEIEQKDPNASRRQALKDLRIKGVAFPNNFKKQHLSAELHQQFGDKDNEYFKTSAVKVSIAGRMTSRRVMGKASFAHLQDMSGKIQLYVKRDNIGTTMYQDFKQLDIGDIIGITGTLMKTKTDELSVQVETCRLLTKSLRSLPEKFHGISDQELRYRQRYLDLIANDKTRETFMIRTKIGTFLRRYLTDKNFIEVETPMMQAIPGGATARPFITHHNSLNLDLYLRIAPELYLKQLVVGGMEKVFELNRNFRNEGLSTRHNPEFTMLEFYQAYADYNDLMKMLEEMLQTLVIDIYGSPTLSYQNEHYDFSQNFKRMTMYEAIVHHNKDITLADLEIPDQLNQYAKQLGLTPEATIGATQATIFEKTVEPKLFEPTFITQYPTDISPLARQNDDNPAVTDRFELFIGGYELANGFSELNDPEEQAKRFMQQAQEKQTDGTVSSHYDETYITALEYGLPPTAGAGIGFDRLVMLMTDAAAIRDVILFPHLRPKQ